MPAPTTVLLRTQSDDRLVALARAGHERAFEAIVERYRRPLLRACRRVLPAARAEDALQQALVAAWTALRRGDDVRELRPWLHRIAHNTALNQLRVAGYDYDELRDALTGSAAADEELERRLIARSALTGLAALPERQREALLQIAVQGRGQEEVARDLGISEPAVRQLVHRARTQLRAGLTAVTPMPLVAWLASAGTRDTTIGERIVELVAGAGAAGAAATAAKVGAVVVLAGGAAANPAVVDRARHGDGSRAEAAPLIRNVAGRARAPTAAPTTTPVRLRSAAPAASRGSDDSARGSTGERTGGGSDRGSGRGSGSSGDDDRKRDDDGSDRGSGSDDRRRGSTPGHDSDDDEPDTDEGDDSLNHGSSPKDEDDHEADKASTPKDKDEDDHEAVVVPTPTPATAAATPDDSDDQSGHDDDTSGHDDSSGRDDASGDDRSSER
jgi:RNA polymerase sigma factor (sigma-70 family)